MEYEIQKNAKCHYPAVYALLRTFAGIGEIYGLVILYEIDDMKRKPIKSTIIGYSFKIIFAIFLGRD